MGGGGARDEALQGVGGADEVGEDGEFVWSPLGVGCDGEGGDGDAADCLQ